MNKAQFIFMALAISAVVGGYNVITSVLELRAAEEEVDNAEKGLIIAQQEELDARERLDNLQKYGCESPAIGQGFVSCP